MRIPSASKVKMLSEGNKEKLALERVRRGDELVQLINNSLKRSFLRKLEVSQNDGINEVSLFFKEKELISRCFTARDHTLHGTEEKKKLLYRAYKLFLWELQTAGYEISHKNVVRDGFYSEVFIEVEY